MTGGLRLETYRGRRVLVTGHTGFKGGWLSLWLEFLGADVTGFSLPPSTTPNLFTAARVKSHVRHEEGDIRDLGALRSVWQDAKPEIVFHLAAQPLVRASYEDPLGTVTTNVIGSTNVLELARLFTPKAVLIVTSDKCYENRETEHRYDEGDRLGGHDVYSASKAVVELLVEAYRRSFFTRTAVNLASARAGNVIGGGDWSTDRLVPDCIRSLALDAPILVRNPNSVRPWQHVLEPLHGYLLLGERLLSAEAGDATTAWNFGPEPESCVDVRAVVEAIISGWGKGTWRHEVTDAVHEAKLLYLGIGKAKERLGWRPRWDFSTAVAKTVDWYTAFHRGDDMGGVCRRQIREYQGEVK